MLEMELIYHISIIIDRAWSLKEEVKKNPGTKEMAPWVTCFP